MLLGAIGGVLVLFLMGMPADRVFMFGTGVITGAVCFAWSDTYRDK